MRAHEVSIPLHPLAGAHGTYRRWSAALSSTSHNVTASAVKPSSPPGKSRDLPTQHLV